MRQNVIKHQGNTKNRNVITGKNSEDGGKINNSGLNVVEEVKPESDTDSMYIRNSRPFREIVPCDFLAPLNIEMTYMNFTVCT